MSKSMQSLTNPKKKNCDSGACQISRVFCPITVLGRKGAVLNETKAVVTKFCYHSYTVYIMPVMKDKMIL